ncbi:MAG: 16S rRNA (uracil(1498)-N(3))-methyltransferase [Actinomycetota bacterium]
MVEPLYLIDSLDGVLPNSTLTLSGPEGRHASTVRRLNPGEAIAVGDGVGGIARGKVLSTSKDQCLVEVDKIDSFSQPKLRFSLVQALAKGDRDELAIQAATELGISTIIPWQAERSISVWKDEKISKGIERWQSIVAEATKQSLRPFLPKVEAPLERAQLVSRLKNFDRVLVLEPTATKSINSVEIPIEGMVAVLVGPEGGISKSELDAFSEAKFDLVRLGPGVLRTSTAGVAALSFLQGQYGEWKQR